MSGPKHPEPTQRLQLQVLGLIDFLADDPRREGAERLELVTRIAVYAAIRARELAAELERHRQQVA